MTWGGGAVLGPFQKIEQIQKDIRALCKCRTEEDRARLMAGVRYTDSKVAKDANKDGPRPVAPAWGGRGVSSLARIV